MPKTTKMIGALSLSSSRDALTGATGDMVKMFANFAVAEQETIADILMSMTMDKAEGALKVPTDGDAGKAQRDQGCRFRQTYLTGQIDDKKKLLMIQEDYLKIGQNREHLNISHAEWSRNTLPTLRL